VLAYAKDKESAVMMADDNQFRANAKVSRLKKEARHLVFDAALRILCHAKSMR